MHEQPRRRRLRGLPRRIVRFGKALFGGGAGGGGWDDVDGGAGVREPRRPLAPTLSGAAVIRSSPARNTIPVSSGAGERVTFACLPE